MVAANRIGIMKDVSDVGLSRLYMELALFPHENSYMRPGILAATQIFQSADGVDGLALSAPSTTRNGNTCEIKLGGLYML